MKKGVNSDSYDPPEMHDRRSAEISYHKMFNQRTVVIALPIFVGALFYFYFRKNSPQAIIYLLLTINAIITIGLGVRLKEIKKLIRLKQISSFNAFSLIAASIITGLIGPDIVISFPWIFIYPVTALLIFGQRMGLCCAVVFCIAALVSLFVTEMPVWNDWNIAVFKINSGIALIFMLVFAVISENSRIRMRNKLLDARNKYRDAEAKQRETNTELKAEIQLRIQSQQALVQSEIHYRTLFEESTVSLWEENYSKVKHYLDNVPLDGAGKLPAYFESNPDAVRACMNQMRITAVNHATLKLCGADSKTTILNNISQILPENKIEYFVDRLSSLYAKNRYEAQISTKTISGETLHLLVSTIIPEGYEHSWERVYTSVYDVTERVLIEEQKKRIDRQTHYSRQIQAIASLAGGIAHQFNNCLAIIFGNLDLLELNYGEEDENSKFIQALRNVSNRIKILTERLLAYAQGGKYQPKNLSAVQLVHDCLSNNKLSQNNSIRISTNLIPDVILSSCDATQIITVLENVISNSIEAMSGEGEIIITTECRDIGEDRSISGTMLKAGKYALITIEDQGIGMDEQTIRRIFEPFFSTKFIGRGLGMAAAFGIVRNHEGIIEVKSELNKGTRVMIYLPAAAQRA